MSARPVRTRSRPWSTELQAFAGTPGRLAASCLGFFFLYSVIVFIALPRVAERYFHEISGAFDVNNYVIIARDGYTVSLQQEALKGLPAFYPLWPWVMSKAWSVTSLPGSLLLAKLLAVLMFVAATFVFAKSFFGKRSTAIVFATVLAFTMNPNSIFHVIPYSESLFSLLAIGVVYFLAPPTATRFNRYFMVMLLTAGACLARPASMQVIASALAAFVFVFGQMPRGADKAFKSTLAIVVGACVGYAVYGFYCLQTFSSFWYPFSLQKLWHREFGLYWSVIFNPHTVGGAKQVLLFDLIAFYLPIIVIGIEAWRFLTKRTMHKHLETTEQSYYIYIFATVFCFMHSLIAFLTYPRFMSMARHNLAVPMFYIMLMFFTERASPPVRRGLWGGLLVLSFAFFGYFWARYARTAWIG